MGDFGYRGFAPKYGEYEVERLKSRTYESKELRKEYQRLYRVAQKRLRAFERKGWENKRAYRDNWAMPASVELTNNDLPYALNEIHRFLASDRSTISGERAYEDRIIEGLHDVGLTFVNRGNLDAFGDYMDALRASKLDKIYGSERLVQLFGAASKKGVDPVGMMEDFEFWQAHVKELESLAKHRDPQKRTLSAYKEEIEAMERKEQRRQERERQKEQRRKEKRSRKRRR